MVEKYRTLLADSAGLKSVTVDGQSVTYGDLERLLEHWENLDYVSTFSFQSRTGSKELDARIQDSRIPARNTA